MEGIKSMEATQLRRLIESVSDELLSQIPIQRVLPNTSFARNPESSNLEMSSGSIKIDTKYILPTNIVNEIANILAQDENSNESIDNELEQTFDLTYNTIDFNEVLKIKSTNKLEQIQFNSNNDNTSSESLNPILRPYLLNLPVSKYRHEILKQINNHTFVLISGDTGCGKTTQIPQIILDHFIGIGKNSECNLICTQPRRISAIAVAERVAWERMEIMGKSVGYQIRLEKCMPDQDNGSILYCTTGVLLRKMESDPLLSNISHIILDEIHERCVESDILIGLLKVVVQYNKKLKIILMSATFGVEEFGKYFNDCTIIRIEGRMYPVEVKYLEDILQMITFDFPEYKQQQNTNFKYNYFKLQQNHEANKKSKEYKEFIEPYAQQLHRDGKYSWKVINSLKNPNSEEINLELMKMLIFYIAKNQPEGAILVFLPGYDKIQKLWQLLETSVEYNSKDFLIYILHSSMPTEEQKGVFEQPKKGVRKIILSTTLAETSITIDDVVYVINSGRVKVKDYDIKRNYEILQEQWITEAHGKQRKGRAGRCQSGICYNLYTRARETTFAKYPIPEIQRTRLEPIILKLKLMRIQNIIEFVKTLISCPNEKTIENGIKLLKRMNLLNENNETITPLGLHLAHLPLDPQIGKMLLIGSIFKCIEPITAIAATLSHKEPFYRPMGKNKELDETKLELSKSSYSDHLLYAYVIQEYDKIKLDNDDDNNDKGAIHRFLKENFIAPSTIKQLKKLQKDLKESLELIGFLYENSNINANNENLLRSIIIAGCYPNIAYIDNVKLVKYKIHQDIRTPEDNTKVKIHNWSVNRKRCEFDSNFLCYYNKQKCNQDICLYDTTMFYPNSLIIFGDQFKLSDNGEYIITIGNIFKFQTNHETFEIIKKLRRRFEILLGKFALNPTEIKTDNDKLFLDALILFLSYNHH